MATTKEFIQYVADQLAEGKEISFRPMMGEYVLYCHGAVVGGVYDNRLLLKPTPSAKEMLPGAREELPYEGAKPMLLVEDLEDRSLLARVTEAIAQDLASGSAKRKPREKR